MLALWPFSLSELRRYKTGRKPFELIVRGCFPDSTKKASNRAGSTMVTSRAASSAMCEP